MSCASLLGRFQRRVGCADPPFACDGLGPLGRIPLLRPHAPRKTPKTALAKLPRQVGSATAVTATAVSELPRQVGRATIVTATAKQLEEALQQQAKEWAPPSDLDNIPMATEDELPALDLEPYLKAVADGTSADAERANLASSLRECGEKIGFCSVINHGISEDLLARGLAMARKFHALPLDTKLKYEMDKNGRDGVGYLKSKNFKLPAREKANMNECFIVKRELGPRNITLDSMPWPADDSLHNFDGSKFRATVIACCEAMERLALNMLPIYAEALELDPHYFDKAFESPLFRLRISHYPPTPPTEFGINPHVDTSFFTILATSGPGLVFHSVKRNRWVQTPFFTDRLVVNTGQLLSQITNDRWLATKHYAVNGKHEDRYSLPFFFNANASYRMSVVPTCVSEQEPAKYPPTSYLEGQGVAQGE